LTTKPKEICEKYYVGEAKDKRNYLYTYEEDGFYSTLKKKVTKKLKTIDSTSITDKSKRHHDMLLFAFLVAASIVNRIETDLAYLFWVIIAGQLLAWLVACSHNFLHKADSWRMYTGNLALMTTRDVRIIHILVSFKL
jgi:hypothetical protein